MMTPQEYSVETTVMKKFLVLIALLACVALMVVANSSAYTASQDIPKESKVQPKEVVLGKESQSDKYGEVPFNHETHSTKNYSIDGKSVIACVECHHTDQPASTLKPPLKTGERDVALTAALLAAADSKPVKSCGSCHLQAGDDSAPMPTITEPEKPAPIKLNNEVAYHRNCNLCHDKAMVARPALKEKKLPGSNDCAVCHKPVASL
jgi:cytochrome c553